MVNSYPVLYGSSTFLRNVGVSVLSCTLSKKDRTFEVLKLTVENTRSFVQNLDTST